MKRLGRWLFNFAAVVSLVLFVGTAVLWVRSYWVFDSLGYCISPPLVRLEYFTQSANGEFVCWRTEMRISSLAPGAANYMTGPVGWERFARPIAAGDDVLKEARVRGIATFGFGYLHDRVTNNLPNDLREDVAIAFPYAVVALVLALTPTRWVVHYRREHLRRPGHCPVCGYDLRATPDRCPECGTIPKDAKGAAT